MLKQSAWLWLPIIIFIAGTFLGQTPGGVFCPDSDLNDDCFVEFDDLAIFAGQWLDPEGCAGIMLENCADLVGNNGVDFSDFAVFAEDFKANKYPLAISEFMASNSTAVLDEDGESSDWIEIHNPSGRTINLGGLYLTDNANDLNKWEFPEVEIGAGEYVLVYASGKNRRDPDSELHTDFFLESSGEYLGLVGPDGENVIYEFNVYPQQYSDISFGLSDMGIASQTETILIDEDAPATALIPTDNTLGLTWTEVDFNDSGWLSGQTGVGYDTGSRYTPLIGLDVLAMRNVNETVYVRIPFVVDDVSAVSQLLLRMKYEDAFVAYLNGNNVVAQDNNPNLGQLTWNSGALANRDDSFAVVYQEFDLTFSKGHLRQGENVLAIHGLNRLPGSSDLLILPELRAVEIESVDLGSAMNGYLFSPTPGAVNDTAIEDIGPAIRDVKHTPQDPADQEDLTITARIEKTLGAIDTVTLHYRVMFDSKIEVDMFDDGLHNDGEALDGIYAATIPASASEPGQMVRWYISASDVQGNTSKAPLYPYPVGSPRFYGTVVEDSSLSSQLPIFHWFVNDPGAADTWNGTKAWVYFDGEFYDNVFVRIRGGTSSALEKKNHKFVFNKGHYFRFSDSEVRAREANINAAYIDTSYMREKLSYELLRDSGVPSCYVQHVRVQQNGSFHSLAIFVEQVDQRFLERHGFESNGPLYKAAINSTLFDNAYDFEPKNDSGYGEMIDLVSGLNLSGTALKNYIFDNLNIPEVVSYLASSAVVSETDHTHKNYYMHLDRRQNLWNIYPWDRDLSFGNTWLGTYVVTNVSIFTGSNNRLFTAIYNTSPAREMFLRRLRTLMDEFLEPASVPAAQRELDNRIAQLQPLLKTEADLDRARWGWTNNSWYSGFAKVNFDAGVGLLTGTFMPGRRNFLYGASNSGQIPNAQPENPGLTFGNIEFNPPSFNQDEEFIRLNNSNSYAVDISGWKLSGGVAHTFSGGTVIPAGNRIYVTPDSAAFRARSQSPKGGEGRFVQGNYKGHLSSWGETIDLFDTGGRLVASVTYQGDPSETQRYLRITEIMYNPDVPGSSDSQAYEYLELKNIGGGDLDLMGLSFTEGISYYFTALPDTVVLGPGEYLILAKNPTIFSLQYTTVPEGTIVLGPYVGQLSNSGEGIKLEDHTHSTILEFGYNDTWFDITDGLGFSLTVRDEMQADLDLWDRKAGWRPSAAAGGSPGWDDSGVVPESGSVVINEVLAHSHAMDPDWIELHNTTNSPIPIGGWFLSDSNNNLMKYEIADDAVIPENGYVVFYENEHFGNTNDPGCHTVFALSENGDSVYLHSGQDGVLTGYSDEEDFGATETNVSLGRYQKSTGTYNFVAMSSNTPGDENAYPLVGPIVISEIMYHPEGDANADAEYIELLNISGGDVDLYDPATSELWKFADEGGFEFFFEPGPVTIEAGERILLVKDAAAFNAVFSAPAGTDIYEWGPDGSLRNSNEKIQLSMPGDIDEFAVRQYIRVDRVVYDDNNGWPTGPDGGGLSLDRKVDSEYGNDVANWQEAIPTPGQ